MENNKLILLENNKKCEYRIIYNIEDVNGKNYIVYTKDERNDESELITYASSYYINKEGKLRINKIVDDDEWQLVEKIVNTLTSEEK